MWNPSTFSFEFDKYCEIGQYLDYKNCVCRKTIIDNLIKNIIDKKMNHIIIII